MFRQAIEFSNKIKDFEGVLSIVLFGSIARGEATRDSDIDLAIIYSEKKDDVVRKINAMAPEKFQLTHLSIEELKDEPTISGALSGEGILLFGKPVIVSVEDIELKPKMIIAYDTSELDQNTRNKLYRALYGGTSTYMKENEKKVKRYVGIADRIRAEKIGKGVLITDRRNAPEITKTLERFNARWKEIPIWTY
ncbi:MAG: nucleotidyltransferase domain-containing protein [Candidatus Hydrothermarchaeota archaeon]